MLGRSDRTDSATLTFVIADVVFNRDRTPSNPEQARQAAEAGQRDMASWLSTHPKLSLVSPPLPATFPGATGVQFEMSVEKPYTYELCILEGINQPCVILFQNTAQDVALFRGSRYRLYVLQVGSARVVVSIEAPEGDFASFSALAERLLATLRFPNP